MLRLQCYQLLFVASFVGVLLASGLLTARADYEYDAHDFVVTVVEYVEGTGIPLEVISVLPFNDPSTAVGRPTIDTTGDNWSIPLDEIVPVVPVGPAFRLFELVSVGHDGHLILMFDHPVANDLRNPYGIDFIVFGNAMRNLSGGEHWTNGDPDSTSVDDSGGLTEPGTVSVSQDGETWYTFNTNGAYADTFAPTLGRVYDPDDPDTSIGEWNEWWGHATDPTLPLDPALEWADFHWMTVTEIAQMYGESAGGTGFDLEWLHVPGLDSIQYVRIDGPSAGGTPEVDAVSDVYPCLGDFDRDGDVDLADFARLQVCFTGAEGGPPPRECVCADFDPDRDPSGNHDVDLSDYRIFESFLTGPS
ncbi:MAG: hypothetical protein GY842_02050 [bacterium]|nr:hypothetical protein [bacterium]